MDLGRMIQKQIQDALEAAEKKKPGQTNVASAVNVSSSGHTTSVFSDGNVTIVQRDGETEVYRHDGHDEEPPVDAPDGE